LPSPEMTPPPMSGVLETVLYYTSEDDSFEFYSKTMGFRSIGHEPGRSMFFRAGASVFLVFNAEATTKGGMLPPHGATGPGHTCFQAAGDEYEAWRDYLAEQGVDIIQEVTWPLGSAGDDVRGRSFYFHDPSGNVLEIADSDFWGR
jgi:catechol 2,3-dioxygenase-like lactoylglutathione lyase family enzyme